MKKSLNSFTYTDIVLSAHAHTHAGSYTKLREVTGGEYKYAGYKYAGNKYEGYKYAGNKYAGNKYAGNMP